jgi:serine/threonine-protein kinase
MPPKIPRTNGEVEVSIIGQTLDNRYEIKKEIGHGQFSIVYLANDKRIQREVAVKKFTKYEDLDMHDRFKQEAFLTGQLRHKYIIEVYDFFTDDNTSYIVMPYCPDTLEKRLFSKKQLNLSETFETMKQVCAGLSQAHSFRNKGVSTPIVHCDLKPGNILFDHHNSVQIADFGIAHVPASNLTQSVFITGTLPYMSPEQLNGKRTFPQIDIYALGAIFYQMLTGRYYLNISDDSSPMAKARNIFSICESPPLVGPLLDKHVPQPLIDLILKALAKEPEERYHNAGEMFEALEKVTELELAQQARNPEGSRLEIKPIEPISLSTAPAVSDTIQEETTDDETPADSIGEQEQLSVPKPPVDTPVFRPSTVNSPQRMAKSRYSIYPLSPRGQLIIGVVALLCALLLVGFVISRIL